MLSGGELSPVDVHKHTEVFHEGNATLLLSLKAKQVSKMGTIVGEVGMGEGDLGQERDPLSNSGADPVLANQVNIVALSRPQSPRAVWRSMLQNCLHPPSPFFKMFKLWWSKQQGAGTQGFKVLPPPKLARRPKIALRNRSWVTPLFCSQVSSLQGELHVLSWDCDASWKLVSPNLFINLFVQVRRVALGTCHIPCVGVP